jgi:tRNA modification GTPase
MERTQLELSRADLVLAVAEAGASEPPIASVTGDAAAARIVVYNKIDLAPGFVAPPGAVAVSAKTGEGLDRLRKSILEAAGWSATGEGVFLARERHLRALERARAHLQAAGEQRAWEFFAEELRLAQEALASITGEFSSDDLLGEIFRRFCIGK